MLHLANLSCTLFPIKRRSNSYSLHKSRYNLTHTATAATCLTLVTVASDGTAIRLQMNCETCNNAALEGWYLLGNGIAIVR